MRTPGWRKGYTVPTAPLPENPSLEHLKGQAKLFRDLVRSRDSGALSMVEELHPRLGGDDLDGDLRFRTADAQLVIARLYGFPSWARLRGHLAVLTSHSFTPATDRGARADRTASFIGDACLDYAQSGPRPADRLAAAHRMLEDDPSLASGSVEAAATVGDHRSLASLLDEDPRAVDTPCGPNRWPPLLYAVYSRIATGNPAWSAEATVSVLLDRGADPNAGFLWRGLVPPFTALTGAFGGGESAQPWHPARLALARALLDAGADPNDGQALYNNGIGGQDHDDPAHLRLLVEYGLGTPQGGPWYERLGDRLREPAELLYDELEAAAQRNRPTVLRFLVSLGLDLRRPVGRSGRTPARIAAAAGSEDALSVLAEAGVDTEPTPAELALRHVLDNRPAELRDLLSDRPSLLAELRSEHPGLCARVAADHAGMLALLVELGFDINDRSVSKTALHHAAEAGDVARLRLLLAHGADPNLVDTHIGATPWGWADHGGHAEAAAYLHPLTEHGDRPHEITVRWLTARRTLATPRLIEGLLDVIERRAAEPVLVTLKGARAGLTVGLGGGDASVALYLDSDRRPWHAAGDPAAVGRRTVRFLSDVGRREFFPTAVIAPAAARAIVREFCLQPETPPPSATWVPEGGADPMPA